MSDVFDTTEEYSRLPGRDRGMGLAEREMRLMSSVESCLLIVLCDDVLAYR